MEAEEKDDNNNNNKVSKDDKVVNDNEMYNDKLEKDTKVDKDDEVDKDNKVDKDDKLEQTEEFFFAKILRMTKYTSSPNLVRLGQWEKVKRVQYPNINRMGYMGKKHGWGWG